LTRHPLLWRGRQAAHHIATLSSGHAALDDALPGHGWPLGAITELIHGIPGCGELSLLLPALTPLSKKKHQVVMVDPPWVPYPLALHSHGLALENLLVVHTRNRKESLWACEQVLHGIPGGALLAWPERLSFGESRRLQLAAESGQKAVFLFRHTNATNTSSPAALRLQLTADDGDLQIRVLKCRGQRPTANIRIRNPQELRPLPAPLANSSGSRERSRHSPGSLLASRPIQSQKSSPLS